MHNLSMKECQELVARVACSVEEAIMSGRLDDDYKGFLDLWEDISTVDILFKCWNDRPQEVKERLIRNAMEDCV